MAFYIDAKKAGASEKLAFLLKKCIFHHSRKWPEIVFLCIGSDRLTGDCLGPYVGHCLSKYKMKGIYVYGSLTHPVHALNLSGADHLIRREHPEALVIAIDAALGSKKHLGYVTIGMGALCPGAGVQKELPPVGDIHITGIVNIGGILEQLTLQTTRLSTVISLADIITEGILDIIPGDCLMQSQPDEIYTNSFICL